MEKKIECLDCTLRDGAYIVEGQFGTPAIKGIISKLQEAGIEIIECGWLKNQEHKVGTTFFKLPKDLEKYIDEKNSNQTYVVMIDWDRYDIDSLPDWDGKTIDGIRVVFPHGKYKEGINIGEKIKKKGYQVYFQIANTLAYTEKDLKELANCVNRVLPESISVVDTFGAMYPEDLERIVKILDNSLDYDIKLGFHSHNNQQLSFSLTMTFIEMLKDSHRGIVVDSSLCGMGRGAGNATTELVVSYLNRKWNTHYNIDAIMDAIDIYMEYFKENFRWGYSTPYFIAGLYGAHVNNIAYLLNNHRTNAKDMRTIIESLDETERKKYDYELLESKYLKNQSYNVNDKDALLHLSKDFTNREILMVAPGNLAISKQNEILDYAKNINAVIIGINAILPGYKYDYLFFANSARYEYAKQKDRELFNKAKKIVLSNVKNIGDDREEIIGFNTIIKRGWKHFDNAVICALRLMDKLQVKKISIAGFDGFKTKYNESYADPYLPSLNPDGKWDELNQEIKEMYKDYISNARYCKEVIFVTESFFNEDI